MLEPRDGRDGLDPRTLDEIGREFGLTRERIRQIEVEALRELAAIREIQGLKAAPIAQDCAGDAGRSERRGARTPGAPRRFRVPGPGTRVGDDDHDRPQAAWPGPRTTRSRAATAPRSTACWPTTSRSPAGLLDLLLDRDGFFERCWPGHENIGSFALHRLVQAGDEVIVTYEASRTDGPRFRNTEVLTFRDEQIVRQEVYFGWDLPARS